MLQRFTASDSDLGVNAALEYSLQQIRPSNDDDVSLTIGAAAMEMQL